MGAVPGVHDGRPDRVGDRPPLRDRPGRCPIPARGVHRFGQSGGAIPGSPLDLHLPTLVAAALFLASPLMIFRCWFDAYSLPPWGLLATLAGAAAATGFAWCLLSLQHQAAVPGAKIVDKLRARSVRLQRFVRHRRSFLGITPLFLHEQAIAAVAFSLYAIAYIALGILDAPTPPPADVVSSGIGARALVAIAAVILLALAVAAYVVRRQLHQHWLPLSLGLLTAVTLAASYLLVCFVSQHYPGPFTAPVLVYILVIVTLFGMALPAIAFYLDRHVIPMDVALVVAVAAGWLWCRFDHYGILLSKSDASPAIQQPATPGEALGKRFGWDKPGAGKTDVVIVAANGGGILAGAWTAQALAGIESFDPEKNWFRQHVALISSVSGGSMGTMFYLDHFADRPAGGVAGDADKPSLEAVGWGMAYLDLPHVILGPLFDPVGGRFWDRGWQLEHSWAERLRTPPTKPPTLRSWAGETAEGHLPTVIFNSTILETGAPFLFATVLRPAVAPAIEGNAFREPVPPEECRVFLNRFSDYDISIPTAVRMSASFPYVSPIVTLRDPAAEKAIHFGDGGDVENTGVMSALQWLESLPESSLAHIRRMLLVRVQNPESPPSHAHRTANGLFNETLGPVGILSTARGYLEEDLPRAYRVEIARRLSERQPSITLTDAPFRLFTRGPLSWRFSTKEARQVQHGFDVYREARRYLQKYPPGSEKLDESYLTRAANGLYDEKIPDSDDRVLKDWLDGQNEALIEQGVKQVKLDDAERERIRAALRSVWAVMQFEVGK